MSRGPDASTVLQRALVRAARATGCTLSIPTAHMTRWASATFTGAQHHLTLQAADDAAFAAWLGEVSDAEMDLRGHLLADIAVMSVARAGGWATASVEALTVEE